MTLETIAASCGAIVTIIGLVSLLFKPVRKWFGNRFAKKDDPVVKAVSDLTKKVDALSVKVDDNEKDRLKDEIFRMGNLARRNEHIASDEFRNLQRTFAKYTKLGGNDIAHDEYNFIAAYYNEQERMEHKNDE